MAIFTVQTQIYCGTDCLSQLRTLRQKKIWIVCDGFLAGSANLKMITDNLDADNEIALFTDIIPDPPIATIAAGVVAMNHFLPQIVIGFGGGSALDSAKAMIYFGRKQGLEIASFIAIPTTSGTGSEVTNAFVISDPLTRIKYPCFADTLYPDIALLEPLLVKSVPPAATANTGLDVLTHALEAYVASRATDFTDALAEKAAQLVLNNLVKAYQDGTQAEPRAKLHHAATLAGIAFSQAGLGLNHAVAHQLGGQLHIPHGLANALLLCQVIRFNSQNKRALAKYAQLSKLCGLAHFQSTDDYCVASLIHHLRQVMQQCQIAGTLGDLGFTREQVLTVEDAMTQAALRDATLVTNPVPAGHAEIKGIIRSIV